MQWLRNLPISRKFFFAFGIVCGLCVVLGAYTFITFRSVAERNLDVSGNTFPSVIYLADVRGGFNTLRRAELGMLLCSTPECKSSSSAKRQKAIDSYQQAIKSYEPFIADPHERDVYQKFLASVAQYRDIGDRAVAALAAEKTGDALDLLMSDSAQAAFDAAAAGMTEDLQLNANQGMEEAQASTGASNRATWVSAGVTLLIVVLCAVIGWTLTSAIAPRIGEVQAALEKMAQKDLTVHVNATGTDEIGCLGNALNTCADSMRGVLHSVAQGAETLSAATTEMSARSRSEEH